MKLFKRHKSKVKQPIWCTLAVLLQMAMALACVVLFFFPFFRFLNSGVEEFATVSQYHLLFGGTFSDTGFDVIKFSGHINVLLGILIPLFMLVVLYYRSAVRPMFAYFIHAVISIVYLVDIFSLRSIASLIVRTNVDAYSYKMEWAWFATALITVLGFALSVLLIWSELSRLKNKQKQFEEHELDDEDDEQEETPAKPEKKKEAPAPAEKPEKKEPEEKKNSSDDDFNSTVSKAIEDEDLYYDDDDDDENDGLTEAEKDIPEEVTEHNEQPENEQPEEKPTEKRTVKVKVKPVSSVKAKEDIKNDHASRPRIKPVNGVRGMAEDFDEHSGY